MNKRNDSVTCAARPAKIFRESHLTNAVHQHISMMPSGLACREVQRLEYFVAGVSSMPSVLAIERGFFPQREVCLRLVGKIAESRIQSFVGSCSSSITRLSKRLAPPPSILRWSKLNVICASVLGTNSFFVSSHDGTFFPRPRPSSNV
jgi:hypothetical protein